MSNSITFSVVVPTVGRSDSLKRALYSVVNQSVVPFEVILVDDSAEQTIDLKHLGFAEDLITIYRTGGRKGASFARNLGYRNSKGIWVAFLDDDDEFRHDKLECVCEHLKKFGFEDQIAVVSHPAEVVMVKQGVTYRSRNGYEFTDDFFERLLVRNLVGGTPVAIVNKSIVGGESLFDDTLPALEDKELWLRLAKKGLKFSFLDQALTRVFHSTGTQSLSKNWEANENAYLKIMSIYSNDVSNLSGSQQKKMKQAIESARATRLVMSERKYAAASKFFLIFIKYHQISALASSISILFGTRFYFKLKAFF